MNTLTSWLHPSGLGPAAALAVEIGVVAAVGALIARRWRSGTAAKVWWRAALLAVLALLLFEGFGAGRWVAARWNAEWSGAEPRITAEVLPGGPADMAAAGAASESRASRQAAASELEGGALRGRGAVVAWLGWGWLCGTGLVLGRMMLARGVFAWGVSRRARPAGAEEPVLRARAERWSAALGLRRQVAIRVLPGLAAPVTYGVWRPALAVPSGFAAAHDAASQDVMVLHELAHVRGRDAAWQALADVVAGLVWWHPAVWWMRGRLAEATERAADEASVAVENGPVVLAECLVALARTGVSVDGGWWRGALGMSGGRFRSGLGRRVQWLLEAGPEARVVSAHERRPWRRRVATLGLGLGLPFAVGIVGSLLVHESGSRDVGENPAGPTGRIAPSWAEAWQESWGGLVWSRLAHAGPFADAPGPGASPTRAAAAPATPVGAGGGPWAAAAVGEEPLSTRTFKIDTKVMGPNLAGWLGEDGPRDLTKTEAEESAEFVQRLHRWLERRGVRLSDQRPPLPFPPPGASAGAPGAAAPPAEALVKRMFAPSTSFLMVRATARELDVVEETLAALGGAEAQVVIETRLVEVPEALWPSLGLEALPSAVVPGSTIGAGDVQAGRLTPAQVAVLIRALEQARGVSVLSAPKVTTLSRRQARIQMVQPRYLVVSENPPPAGSPPGTANEVVSVPVDMGISLDVVPVVLGDSGRVRYTLMAAAREFVGYDGVEKVGDPGREPQPVVRKRSMVVRAEVADGETVVLSGGLDRLERVAGTNAGPVTAVVAAGAGGGGGAGAGTGAVGGQGGGAAAPVGAGASMDVGPGLRAEVARMREKRWIVLVTATEIDPAGNRVRGVGRK